MTGSIERYCNCRDESGRRLFTRCPQLTPTSKHGAWQYRDRVPPSAARGASAIRRNGFSTRKEAEAYRTRVHDLLALARGDAQSAVRVGDLIVAQTPRGGDLPSVELVKRRLGLRGELDRSQTTGDYLESWFAGKRALRESVRRSYEGHLNNWLIPQLGDVPLDRLSADHINDLFDLIEDWNAEIRKAHAEHRRPVLPGDRRKRADLTNINTQRRIFATLRAALNAAVKSRKLDFNPCDGVEMPGEIPSTVLTWSPDQVSTFFGFCEETDERLAVLFRLVFLYGLRRGEVVGARRSRFDHRTRTLTVAETLLQLGGKVVDGWAKTRAGERRVVVDPDTADLIKRECAKRSKEKLAFGEVYSDHDLIFAREDGTPYPPDYVSRRFRELTEAGGLPRIRFHDGRHSAASLRLEAGVDVRIVSEMLGHSNTAITQNIYQHVRRTVHDQANEAVIRLLPDRHSAGADPQPTSAGDQQAG